MRQPREFRIPRPFLAPEQAEWVSAVLAQAAAAEAVAAQAQARVQAQEKASPDEQDQPDALLGAANGLWRAQRKLKQRGDALSAADVRQIRRYIGAGRDALLGTGLEMQDHDGEPFDPSQSLEVLLFQDEPELTRETVMETVRPTIYLHGGRIQMGQVVVGRPAHEQTR